jgi:hypothetical protein
MFQGGPARFDHGIRHFSSCPRLAAGAGRPCWINSSTWAFTRYLPASVSTTRSVSEGAAARLASSWTVTLLIGANVQASHRRR